MMLKKVRRLGLGLIGGVLLIMVAVLGLAPKTDALVESDKTAELSTKPIVQEGTNDGIDRLLAATNGAAVVSLNQATNVARFVRLGTGSDTLNSVLALQNKSLEGAAVTFFQEFGDAFGISDPEAELVHQDTKTDSFGASRVAYEQIYQGVPVFAGQLYAHFDSSGRLTAVNGTFVPDIAVNVNPTLAAESAANIAISEVAGQQENDLFSVSLLDVHNDLLIFRTGLIQGIAGVNHLAYRIEVTDTAGGIREFVFVDAHSGKVLDQITGIHEDLDRKIYLEAFDPTALVWQEGDPYPYVGPEELGINRLIDYAEDTYDLFYNISGGQVVSATAYDSYDGNGATMHSVYNDPRINCPNANWNGVSTNYCTNVDGDDTVAHEWTHAYQDFTHGLIYQWQPGALNESYSDIFGEIVDMVNGAGLDAPDVLRTADTCSLYTRVPTIVRVNTPASIAGDYSSNQASFGPTVDGTLTGDVMAADDGTGATATEACNPLVNDLTGKIAFIRRGSCNFTVKVKNAQNAGAIGAIVANHASGGDNTFSMAGVDTSITIQSVMVGYSDGNAIEAQLGNTVNVNILPDPSIATEDSLRWLSGEDDPAFGGAIRDMWNPGCYGDPGEVIEDNYMCGTADGGGVHTNSGVPNHAFALLVDGGTYNGVTVPQVGLTKTAAIYWRSMSVYQNPATDFTEHADALEQSCTDLIGQDIYDPVTGAVSSAVINGADCTAIADAMLAVEMRSDPTAQCGFTPLLEQDPPNVCEGIGNPVAIYTSTFESGATGWLTSTDVAYPGVEPLMWELTSTLPGMRAGSAFYAVDEQGGSCNADADDDSRVLHLDSPMITIPAATTHARVSFWHWVATEIGFDGGNVKISVNGGPWQVVEGRFYTFNPYNGTLTAAPGNTNPIAGEEGFTGSDGGSVFGTWGQSQVNVSRYAKPGDTIQLRFDFGSDGCSGLFGWYVDDVDVFYCDAQVDPDIAVFAEGVEDNESGFGLSASLGEGQTEQSPLEIMNTGINDLSWFIEEEPVAVSEPSAIRPLDQSGRLSAMELNNSSAESLSSQAVDGPASVTAATVVQDGGFEAGDDFEAFGGGPPNPFWNSYGQPVICTGAICGGNALNGTNYFWVGAFSSDYSAGVTQTVNLANTGDAQLTFYLWVPTPSATDQLTVSIDSTPVFTLNGADGGAYEAFYALVTVDISGFADGAAHVLDIEAYAAGTSSFGFLIDDVSINDNSFCLNPSDVPWIGALKTNGVVARDTSEMVNIFFDSTGLTPGVYEANICVNSNAPEKPVVAVPVSLEVLHEVFMPIVTR